MFIFQLIRYSNVLYVFRVRKGPSTKYLRNWCGDGGRVIQNAYSYRQGGGGRLSRLMYTYGLALSVFMFWQHFCVILSCLICRNLTLPLLNQKRLFFYNEISLCRHEIRIFDLKLFL